MTPRPTAFERFVTKVKNQKLVAILLVIGLFVIGLSQFTNAIEDLGHFFGSFFETRPASGGSLTVQVYDGGTNQRLANMELLLEKLGPDEAPVTQRTDDRGTATFAVELGDMLNLSVKMQRDGVSSFGADAPFMIRELPMFRPIDVKQIREDAWVAAGPAPPERAVQVASLPVNSMQPESGMEATWLGNRDLVARNAPWGIPTAEYIVAREAFTLGFDPHARIPRWVANATRSKPADYRRPTRQGQTDPMLPPDIQAHPTDYRGTGYDRGNLVSALDVAFNGPQASMEAYYMSAIAPQTPMLNRKVWAELERYCRDLAKAHGVVYLLSGTAFVPVRKGEDVDYFVIGANRVAVPTHFFRIVARQDENGRPDVLAFLIPNAVRPDTEFASFLTSVKSIEDATGLHIFPELNEEDAARIKPHLPGELWPIGR